MPLNKLFRQESVESHIENDFLIEAIQTKMLEKHQALEVYQTDAWRILAEELQVEADAAYRDVMNSATGEPLALARERAKTYARILGKPQAIEAELAGLREQLREVQESEDG